jgi:hypothetical protein
VVAKGKKIMMRNACVRRFSIFIINIIEMIFLFIIYISLSFFTKKVFYYFLYNSEREQGK